MAKSRNTEERYLNKDERELVSAARHPELSTMSVDSLKSLAKRLRERRDRAKSLDRKHVRSSRSAEAGTVEEGNRQKTALLSAAVSRVNKEFARREQAQAI